MKNKKVLISLALLLALGSSIYVFAEPITCKISGVKNGYDKTDSTYDVWVNNATCASRCEPGGTKVCNDYEIKAVPIPD